MNLFQTFLLGIGSVVLLVVVAALMWATSRNKTMKLPGIPRNGWILVAILVSGVVIDLLFGNPFLNFITDIFKKDGELQVWMWAGLIAIVAGLVLVVIRKREGVQALRTIAVFATIVFAAVFILDRFTPGSSREIANGCSDVSPFQHKYVVTERKDFVLLPGGKQYTVMVPTGRELDFRIEFSNTPLKGEPNIDLGEASEFVDYATVGDGTPLSLGLTYGAVRLLTNRDAYNRRVNNQCLGYYVYLQGSEEEPVETVEEAETPKDEGEGEEPESDS